MPSRRELVDMLSAVVRAAESGALQPGGTLLGRAAAMAARALGGNAAPQPWTPLTRAHRLPLTPAQMVKLTDFAAQRGAADAVPHLLRETDECELWTNASYQVLVRRDADSETAYLSIKRIDQAPIRSWRDLQRIKNEIVGPECEAIEIYPAESRLVDTANQYHLWASTDPAYRFPVGFSERMVEDGIGAGEGQSPHETAAPT